MLQYHFLSMKKKIKKGLAWFKKDRRRIIAGAVILVVVVITSAFLLTRNGNKTQYQTAVVEKGNLVSTVTASGQVISANIINIATSATGIVKKVYVIDGQKVSTGQIIMEITLDPDSQAKASSSYASYISAKNNVDSATTSLWTLQSQAFSANQKFINDAAARNLATDDPTYIQEWADWKAAEEKYNHQSDVINQAKTSLNSAWLSYKSVSPTIYAPMTGTIENLTYTEGMNLVSSSSENRVAILKTTGNPLASFNVSEIDINKIKPGQKATITADALSDKTFTGVVKTVDRIGTVTSGVTNYPVVIAFDTEVPELTINMAVSANIILETKDDVLIIPSSAVHTTDGQSYVLVMENGSPVQTSVEVGISSDTDIEIVSGLNEGDSVVTSTVSSQTSSSGTSPFSSFGGGTLRGGTTIRTGR
jgi:RND family efflux transporter MFP subunit